MRDDVVWARGNMGTLWKLAARDGRVLARWGFAGGDDLFAVGSRLALDDVAAVVLLDPARATGPDPELEVTGSAVLVTGSVSRTEGLRVRVGDEVVLTQADGSFTARVRGRGGVLAWVEGDPASPCDQVTPTWVPAGAPAQPITLRRVARVCRGG